MATRKTTGDLTTRRGAGDPETRAEWIKVSRYGHLQSAAVVVDACYARSGNRLHSVHPCVVYTRFGASSMASCISVDAQTRRCDPTRSLFRKFTWSAERSNSPALPCPCGLWASMRHPARRRVVQSGEGLEGASDTVHLSGVYRKLTRRSMRSREFAATSWWFRRFSFFFRPHELWASLRRSVGVRASARLQSTHRNQRERETSKNGKLLLLTVPVMLFKTLLTVTCLVSSSPEEYKKWYSLGDGFSNFSVFCGFLRQFLALCSHLFVKSALILFDVCLS